MRVRHLALAGVIGLGLWAGIVATVVWIAGGLD